jgi:hypothetical protein
MSAPTDTQRDAIARQITAAWTDLRAARLLWAGNPTGDTIRHEELAEKRLNLLLDRYHDTMTPAQQAAARARPIRVRR